MTCYSIRRPLSARGIRVVRFGESPVEADLQLRSSRRRLVVRVTHASVGVTDVMAARGDYLLHPVPGFVLGYDFVGSIEQLPDGESEFFIGQRVAGILPHMGAHASRIAVAPSLLVPVPENLDSAVAATVPLDAVTAWFALEALGCGQRDLVVQGVGGAVGAWAAQLAAGRGLSVYGTASPRSRRYAEHLGARTFDYRDPVWMDELNSETGGGVTGAVDHTGSIDVRRVVRPEGRIVRTAFGGDVGKQRQATALGSGATISRLFRAPTERICSVPLIVATRRAAYRQALDQILASVAQGEVSAAEPIRFSVPEYADALRFAAASEPGRKVIIDWD